jgi:hypothetical protein
MNDPLEDMRKLVEEMKAGKLMCVEPIRYYHVTNCCTRPYTTLAEVGSLPYCPYNCKAQKE